jgi:hypothetical protein
VVFGVAGVNYLLRYAWSFSFLLFDHLGQENTILFSTSRIFGSMRVKVGERSQCRSLRDTDKSRSPKLTLQTVP